MIRISQHKIIVLLAFAVIAYNSYGQADTSNTKAVDDLSLKDLLNVKIVSASKKQELLFDAPLSSSVLTREEMRKAGVNSIMEAMRLIPGMIVREESNGNYDIHLRGMDNVPPNAPFDITSNTTTLVMIDNRPVYSYLRGGTFWETLPIDLNDVERIEVIRGPAAALYGPNAVNGVINIITRQIDKEGLYLVANAQQGSNMTVINNASLGFRSKKWSVIASGNYQVRDRTQETYFEFFRNTWLDDDNYMIDFANDTLRNVQELYPDETESMEKYAGNLFANYSPNSKVKFSLSTGIQHSMAQRVSIENQITPLSEVFSESRYVDIKANIKSFFTQVSYNTGTQIMELNDGFKYDFSTLDINTGYNYSKGRFSLKPEVSYRKAIYDDTKYSDLVHRSGIFNNRGQLITGSASLHGEYRLFDNRLRLVAGISVNRFNYPDTTYLAYEFAATYKINNKHLIRAVYSRSPRSSNIFDTYVDHAIALYQTGYQKYEEMAVVGNKSLHLLTADMVELGYRGNLTPHLSIDAELFHISATNFNIPVQHHSVTEFDNGVDTIHETPLVMTNLPLVLQQEGITVSLTWAFKDWQFKPFITVQNTVAKNYYPSTYMPDAELPNARTANIYSGIGTTSNLKSTPTVFGGGSFNYLVTQKLNLNINAYYYSAQTYYHLTNLLFNDGVRGIDHIEAKFILNTNLSYEIKNGFHIFLGGKNLLNNKAREFFKTDQVPFRLMGGINFEL